MAKILFTTDIYYAMASDESLPDKLCFIKVKY